MSESEEPVAEEEAPAEDAGDGQEGAGLVGWAEPVTEEGGEEAAAEEAEEEEAE